MSNRRRIAAILLALASWIVEKQTVAQEAPAMLFEDPATGADAPEAAAGSTAGSVPAAPAAPNPYAGDLMTRYRLTGDWWGARSALAESGLTFDLFDTQFYQGVASGGQTQKFRYGGKIDYLFNLDAGKLNVWPGFFTTLHAETRYGSDVNNIDGLLAPSNLPMNFPKANTNITSITGLKFTQMIGQNLALYFGKINSLDEYGFRYSPGLGTNRPGLEGFLNTSLVFNPIVARTVPYSTIGTGFAFLREGQPWLSLSVFDPEERAATWGGNFFARGVVLVPNLMLQGKPLGRPGKLNFGGTWSSAQYRSFDPASYLSLPPQLIFDERFSPKETGSWSLYTNFYQALWVDEQDESRTWGVFGQFGISDGNPNPIKFVANGGIGGRSIIPGRTLDTFGVGYFHLGLSNNFKTLSRPFLPQGDEYGGELFYNAALTPWARFTVDLQIARPSTVQYDTVIIPGIRLQILF
ncbi:carbohydrate porin [Paludisphaera rhizosphaerae]|uniref:carbohydrate porin n=1 Tax=Paludisphaera rhizosphaerae TaxID=2711216 RepID=UPI0013ED40CB|nr:carbohydrate porin [Paludisphaera rhizosphaerae]